MTTVVAPPFAIRADSPHHIIVFLSLKTLRQTDGGNVLLAQAERPVTDDARRVDMMTWLMIVILTTAFVMPAHTFAVLVFSCSVVEEMQQLVFLKEGQRPEQGRTVHCREFPLEFCGREGIRLFLYLAPYQQSHGCGTYPVTAQNPVGLHHSSSTR